VVSGCICLHLVTEHAQRPYALVVSGTASASNCCYSWILEPDKIVCCWLQMGGIYQHVARLQVALLRTCPQRPHTHATAAAALPHLRQLAGLLDNYLHPSNTGELGS
jgi:hypothetical protein